MHQNKIKIDSQPHDFLKSTSFDTVSSKTCLLIPEAAKLMLSQIPKNRTDLAEKCRDDFQYLNLNNSIIPTEEEFVKYEAPNDLNNIEFNGKNNFYESSESFDDNNGLEVIHEEQLESENEDESNFSSNEFYSSSDKNKNNLESCFEYETDKFNDSSKTKANNNSEMFGQDVTPENKNQENSEESIIMKHIRVPFDWDPDILLRDIYLVREPKSNNFEKPTMRGYIDLLTVRNIRGVSLNKWTKLFCDVSQGKLNCYDTEECQSTMMTLDLFGGKVNALDSHEFYSADKADSMANRIFGLSDRKSNYQVFQCSSSEETLSWLEVFRTQIRLATLFHEPFLPRNPSLFRDIIIIDIGSTNIRAGIVTNQPTLPGIFFNAVMSENETTGEILYGNDVFIPENRKKSKILFPFESTSKISNNSIDIKSLTGFMRKIYKDLKILSNNYRLILTLPRRIDKRCRQSILQLLFNDFEARSVLICHQSVISFWGNSVDNGIVVDIGERCDIVPISQGFVLDQGWARAPFGANSLKNLLRQSLGPQENGLYLSTPAENLVLRYISENFLSLSSDGGRRASQDSQEIVVELDLRSILPFSNLIGVNQEVLRGVGEGFFDPNLYGLDCESLQKILYKSLQDCGVDIRKEMSQNIFISGGSTLIPGFSERLESELNKLCPPHLRPKIHASPYRYHGSFIGASVLAGTDAFEKSLLKKQDYDGGSGPPHWLI